MSDVGKIEYSPDYKSTRFDDTNDGIRRFLENPPKFGDSGNQRLKTQTSIAIEQLLIPNKSLEAYSRLSDWQKTELLAKRVMWWRGVHEDQWWFDQLADFAFWFYDPVKRLDGYNPLKNLNHTNLTERTGVGKAFASSAYIEFLREVVARDSNVSSEAARKYTQYDLIFPLITASAPQRCEAMLLAANQVRWEPKIG